MNKLLNKLAATRKNKTKGFTLVELIVVIVIIAILIAALTPAIMGVIRRANISADDTDARTVMLTAASLFDPNAPGNPDAAAITTAITGLGLRSGMIIELHFDGNGLAVGARIHGGARHADSHLAAGNVNVGIVANAVAVGQRVTTP